MKKFSRLLAGAASLAAAAALIGGAVTTASAAPNDPPKGVTPAPYDLVGVGSNTTQYVMDEIASLFDATVKDHSPAHPKIYSFDAVKPDTTSTAPTDIVEKSGCKTQIRPNGSSAGITALDATQHVKYKGGTYPCINFARSSRGRKSTDPKKGPGGVEFVAFAKDALTWAVRSTAHGGSDAPKSLNLAQLKAVFTCKDTNWKQVGGKNAAIKVYLPQPGSGTLSSWETDMGITTPGSCVSQAPEENEGTYKGFNSPNAVAIYSIGAYVAQKYHSAACGKTPKGSQNKFGCNTTGVLQLQDISGVSPLSSGKVPTINPKFPSYYYRTIYNVVAYDKNTSNHMTTQLNAIFGRTGYLCKSKTAQTEIRDYGFVTTSLCGSTS